MVGEVRRRMSPLQRRARRSRGSTNGAKHQEEEKKFEKDMSKVKFFACGEMGHYASNCPKKKGKKKDVTASAKVEEFASRFESEFALVVSLATSATSTSVWFIDSGVSCHMTGVREHFTSLTKGIDLEVVLGDDTKAAGVGAILFQRESLPPLKLTVVLYVPGLTRNLIFVSCIKDRGYVLLFWNGQLLMYPVGSSMASARVIGVCDEKLYRFIFKPSRTVRRS